MQSQPKMQPIRPFSPPPNPMPCSGLRWLHGWIASLLTITLVYGHPATAETLDAIHFDHAISRVDRLEFYRLEDFGPAGSRCHECKTAQHASCDPSCYAAIPSLSLVCSQKIRGLSIGPYSREGRARVLGELFKTDTIVISTDLGEEPLDAPSISSEGSGQEDDYAIDINGLEGFKNSLLRASSSQRDQFNIQVGSEDFVIPLNPKISDDLHRFIRQCPD